MRIPFLNLAQQIADQKNVLTAAFEQVLQQGPLVGGAFVKNFETKFADYFHVPHCISTGNGTDSLFAALKMLGIGAGHEVITPAWSWISTAETITLTGAKPVFADVDPQTYTLSVDEVAKKITRHTKAIMAVHLYGQCCNMTMLNELARQHNLFVIEDGAQAHGAQHQGQWAGTMGTVGSFSFYPTKNLGALGDAGCLITHNPTLAEQLRRFVNHGGLSKDDHSMEGMNSRMDALQAAVLTYRIDQLNNGNKRRQAIAGLYSESLATQHGLILPTTAANNTHVVHLYVIRTQQRRHVQQKLADAGIETLIHYPCALPFEPAYAYLKHSANEFPVAAQLQHEVLSLPCHPYLSDAEVAYICESIKKI